MYNIQQVNLMTVEDEEYFCMQKQFIREMLEDYKPYLKSKDYEFIKRLIYDLDYINRYQFDHDFNVIYNKICNSHINFHYVVSV